MSQQQYLRLTKALIHASLPLVIGIGLLILLLVGATAMMM